MGKIFKDIIKLRNFLITGVSWQNLLQIRIQEINKKLEEDSNNQELITEKSDIIASLKTGRYHLGTYPFNKQEGREDADLDMGRLMLRGLHILDMKDIGINPETAKAVRLMMKENFEKLDCAGVNENYEERSVELVYEYKNCIEKLINGEQITLNDMFNKISEKEVDKDIILFRKNLVNASNKLANRDLLKELYEIMKFVGNFDYYNKDLSSISTIFLSIAFENINDITNYLAEEAEFNEHYSLVQESITPYRALMLHDLNHEQLKDWQQINAVFGKKALRWFVIANKIKKELDVSELLDSGFTQKQIEEKLESAFKKVVYDRASENQELADIAINADIDEDEFNKMLDEFAGQINPDDIMPDIKFSVEQNGKKYYFSKLDIKSNLHELLNITNSQGWSYNLLNGKNFPRIKSAFCDSNSCFYILREEGKPAEAAVFACLTTDADGNSILFLDNFMGKSNMEHPFFQHIVDFIQRINASDDLHFPDTYICDFLIKIEYHKFETNHQSGNANANTINKNQLDLPKNLRSNSHSKYNDINLRKITNDTKIKEHHSYENNLFTYSNFEEFVKHHSGCALIWIENELGHPHEVFKYKYISPNLLRVIAWGQKDLLEKREETKEEALELIADLKESGYTILKHKETGKLSIIEYIERPYDNPLYHGYNSFESHVPRHHQMYNYFDYSSNSSKEAAIEIKDAFCFSDSDCEA